MIGYDGDRPFAGEQSINDRSFFGFFSVKSPLTKRAALPIRTSTLGPFLPSYGMARRISPDH